MKLVGQWLALLPVSALVYFLLCLRLKRRKEERSAQTSGSRITLDSQTHLHVMTKREGAEHLPTVFFIHGLGGRSDQFKSQIEDFDKKGFRIIAFDALGHGKSNKPKRQSHYATSTFVKNALQIFRKYKSPSKNILVGHSYGTVVALHVLEHELNGCGGDQMKCSIKKIALLGSFPRPKPVPPALPWIPSFVLELIRPLISKGFKDLAWHANTSSELVAAEKVESDKNPMWLIKYSSLKMSFTFPKFDSSNPNSNKIEALLMTGESDKITPLHEGREVLQKLSDASAFKCHPLMVIENASHQLMLEQFFDEQHGDAFVSTEYSKERTHIMYAVDQAKKWLAAVMGRHHYMARLHDLLAAGPDRRAAWRAAQLLYISRQHAGRPVLTHYSRRQGQLLLASDCWPGQSAVAAG